AASPSGPPRACCATRATWACAGTRTRARSFARLHSRSSTVEGGGSVKPSRPDKVMFTEPDTSKAALADYYRAVADAMLPHLRDRPLALQRFPDGAAGPGFFQK